MVWSTTNLRILSFAGCCPSKIRSRSRASIASLIVILASGWLSSTNLLKILVVSLQGRGGKRTPLPLSLRYFQWLWCAVRPFSSTQCIVKAGICCRFKFGWFKPPSRKSADRLRILFIVYWPRFCKVCWQLYSIIMLHCMAQCSTDPEISGHASNSSLLACPDLPESVEYFVGIFLSNQSLIIRHSSLLPHLCSYSRT